MSAPLQNNPPPCKALRTEMEPRSFHPLRDVQEKRRSAREDRAA